MKKMLTLEAFEQASEIVRKVTNDTSLIYSDYFSSVSGNKVYLKPENMQVTGAYKIRGASPPPPAITRRELRMPPNNTDARRLS